MSRQRRRLCADLTLDQINDFFAVGKPVTGIETVPMFKLDGYSLNPETGEAAKPVYRMVVPPYRRHARDDAKQLQYADEAKKQDEINTMHLTNGGAAEHDFDMNGLSANYDDGISSVSMLEKLADTASVFTDRTRTTTIQLPDGMTEEKAVHVYRQYNFSHDYNNTLSIIKYRKDIIDMIENNQVTVIQGETGSGKTTQVPQFILDHYAEHNRYCNIVVTQPRRIAAISIARRVCAERNWQVGGICGYQVGMDKVTCEDTRLTYLTTGVLLQKLITGKNMNHYTHVILDEVHERDQDSDFCLLVVKKLLRSNSKDVKVVLMSATFDSTLFAQYFARPIRGYLQSAPIMKVKGRSYEVAEYFLEDLQQLGRIPNVSSSKPCVLPETVALATSLIENLDKLEGVEPGELAANRGSVLVFLPGIDEIWSMDTSLERILRSHKLWIRPLHSTITGEEQAKVFDRPPPGHRKVILSTNIAESSITVSDIKYVIDFCLTKQLVCDPETNYTCLQMEWASKANCIQRKGRAGRVSNGRVYRLVPHRFWRESIPEYGLPEMQRCPLEQLILKVKLLDLGEPKAILGLALSPPNVDDIEKTIMLLKEVGALAPLKSGKFNPHDGELTFLGIVLGSIPLDIRLGKLIMYGYVFNCLDEMIIISACLSLRSFFVYPFRASVDAYKNRFAWSSDSFSDCLAYYNGYVAWKNRNFATGNHSVKVELEWGRKNFIQIKRIREVDALVVDLTKRLRKFNICNPRRRNRHQMDSDHLLIMKLTMCGAFYPHYFLQTKSNEENTMKELYDYNPQTTVTVKGVPVNQGALYKKEIEKLFTQCNGRRPKVHFEGSRAFVEFIRDPSEQGVFTSAVYVAMKIRHLRTPMQLSYVDVEQVKAHLNELSLKASDPNSSGLLQWNGDVADGDLHPPPFEFPSPSESIVEVTKSEIIACGHLWVNFVRDGPIRSELHSRIQQYARLARRVEALETNMYVLAPYADVASTDYYRARIEDLEDLNATVFFVDYGNYQQTPVHELRTIDPALLQWPVQAAECFLAQIEPSAIKCPEKQWTSEAKDCFAHFLNESSVTYIQIFSIVHGIMRVTVNIKYRGDELNLNEELIRLNYADRVEESLASMQNHLLRERLMLDSCNPNPDNKPDLRTVCQLKEAEERSQIPKKSLGVVFLSGPSNPCEVGFSSTTLNGQLRTTRINRDSVNSVAFDMEPGSPSRRVLVAAFVGLLPTGRTITANGTTLMPNIPGLHGLLALLFCPTAELRADREKKRYVGAICGLGWDSETPDFDPAFPDHDMEVAFNTEFDVEDLKVINGVRIAINLALGTDKTNVEWSEDAVIKIQNTAREKLLWLMKRPRKTIPSNSELGSRAYRWRQVDERDILHPNVAEMDPGLALLTLHCGIALNIDSDDEEIQEMSAENKLIHQQYLESKAAKRSVEPQELFCELCQTILSCPEQLYYHLRTLEHRRKLPIV